MTIMIRTDKGLEIIGDSAISDIQGTLAMLSFHKVTSVELEAEYTLPSGDITQDLRINYINSEGIPQTFIIDIFKNK